MNLENIIRVTSNKLRKIGIDPYDLLMISPYNLLDSLYTPTDRQRIRRTKNIRFIPNANNRRGGKYSYAEWAHVIGIFQTLMFLHLEKKENNTILEVPGVFFQDVLIFQKS